MITEEEMQALVDNPKTSLAGVRPVDHNEAARTLALAKKRLSFLRYLRTQVESAERDLVECRTAWTEFLKPPETLEQARERLGLNNESARSEPDPWADL